MNAAPAFGQGDFFAASERAAKSYIKAKRKRDIERASPHAARIATAAGKLGVTAADLRVELIDRGIITGEEQGRELSWLGQAMVAAKLTPKMENGSLVFRRSHVDRSKGNLHVVYLCPSVAQAGY